MGENKGFNRPVSGMDVPPFDPSGYTALNAATMMWELLCVMAMNVSKRRA